jgi:hypothetical protein
VYIKKIKFKFYFKAAAFHFVKKNRLTRLAPRSKVVLRVLGCRTSSEVLQGLRQQSRPEKEIPSRSGWKRRSRHFSTGVLEPEAELKLREWYGKGPVRGERRINHGCCH